MWWKKFLEIISRVFPINPLSGIREDVLARLNPNKIYVENVRSLLGISHNQALRICETAVRQGYFERRVEVLCPDGRAAASAEVEANLPSIVTCWQEEDGHYQEVELPTSDLQKLTYYRLNEQETARLYETTA
jgi:hypothetical protein